MERVVRVLVVCLALSAAPVPGLAQVDRFDQYRIFLHNGLALPSYGDYAVVGDRVVFTLPVGASDEPPALQLMSLPLTSVDLDRTERYSTTLRAARYAVTRGEADYRAMTDEVARAIDQLRTVEDPARRLALAEEAKRRLLDWSRQNYSYRAADIAELAGLFDEVIAELRIAAGETAFSLDLRTGPAPLAVERVLDAPTFSQSIALALRAADATDLVDERLAILRTAQAAMAARGETGALRMAVDLTLEAELEAERAYAELEADLTGRAETAVTAGDVLAVEALRAELAARDEALGRRRARRVEGLRGRLTGFVDAALARRLALDRYEAFRAGRLAYERRVRPVMSSLDGLAPVLEAIRDRRRVPFAKLESLGPYVTGLNADLARVDAPDDLTDVHATLSSALVMAGQAIARWRRAVITGRTDMATDASAAAGGALLLGASARDVLVERLFPPKVR